MCAARGRRAPCATAAAALVAALAAAPTRAAAAPLPLAAWAPPEAEHALLLSLPRDLLREYQAPLTDTLARLDELAGAAPGLRALSEHLRALDWAQGTWGGVDLTRGVGLYVTGDSRVRVVVAVSDEEALRAQLARHADALGGAPSLSGVSLKGRALRCALAEGWWACDSAPLAAGAAPAWASQIPSNASLWARFGGGETLVRAARALKVPGPARDVEAVTLSMVSEGDARQRATLTTLDVALPSPILALLSAGAPAPGAALAAAHALSPATARLTLPMGALRPFIAQAAAGAPPARQPALKLALELLSGEVQLSFAGSLLRPVLSLGLTAPRGAELLAALVGAAAEGGAPVGAWEEEGLTALRLSPSPKVNLTLKALSAPGALHLALHSADLRRIARAAEPGAPTLEAITPPAAAAAALLSLHITATPRALLDGLAALNEVLEVNLPGGAPLHLGPLMALFAHTYDSMIDSTLWLSAAPGRLTLNALSRTLGGDL
ncbi:MAG: hypothetical protein FJ138_15420 [Deltaproteobacteria bacterium]|nr:hypothetical protein [Deltaproteobacteria bacterium]